MSASGTPFQVTMVPSPSSSGHKMDHVGTAAPGCPAARNSRAAGFWFGLSSWRRALCAPEGPYRPRESPAPSAATKSRLARIHDRYHRTVIL